MALSILETIGIVSAVVIPWLIWEWRKMAMIKKLVDMHEAPDQYGFGTGGTNSILSKQTTALSQIMTDQHRSTEKLVEAVDDLTHYIRWFTHEQTGRQPPPPLKDSG